MMKNYAFIPLFLLVSVTISHSQQMPLLSKEEVIELYKSLYLTSELNEMPWQGNDAKCKSGKIENYVYVKATNRINFFRLVNGLTTVKNNKKFNKEAQDAAMIIRVNNKVTHYPKKYVKCYSQSAANGCKKSNLTFTDFKHHKAIAFITGFIYDYGESNHAVAHRRWILYSKLNEFGYGATDNTEALLILDGIGETQSDTLDYVAYPWHGYVPYNLIFPKWSFSIPADKKVDFNQVRVSMTDSDGNLIEFEILKEEKKYPDHTAKSGEVDQAVPI